MYYNNMHTYRIIRLAWHFCSSTDWTWLRVMQATAVANHQYKIICTVSYYNKLCLLDIIKSITGLEQSPRTYRINDKDGSNRRALQYTDSVDGIILSSSRNVVHFSPEGSRQRWLPPRRLLSWCGSTQ